LLVALGLIFVLQLVDVGLRLSAGAVPVLGIGVLILVGAALGWTVTRRRS
jgi:hypothetical protein